MGRKEVLVLTHLTINTNAGTVNTIKNESGKSDSSERIEIDESINTAVSLIIPIDSVSSKISSALKDDNNTSCLREVQNY